MTIVQGKLIGAATPSRVEMKATLVDVTGKPAVGYVASVPGEVVKAVPIQAEDDGDWTVTLTGNAAIESLAGDTLWAIQEGRALDGAPILTYVLVPETGGPYWAGGIRVDLSGTITGGGTVVFVPGPAGAQGATGPTGPAGPQGATGETGPQPPLGAAGAGPTVALRSDDPTLTNARTPTAHASTHATAGSDPVTPAAIGAYTTADAGVLAGRVTAVEIVTTDLNTYVTDALNRVLGLENTMPTKASLTGATFTGAVVVNGADLTVLGTDKGYRFRRGGGALDLEATGSDLLISNWSGTAFNGTQRSYDRYSSDALNVQHAGKREFVSALYGTTRHVIDGTENKTGWYGATPVGRQPVTGSWADGSAGASLAAALHTLGWIDDQTTA